MSGASKEFLSELKIIYDNADNRLKELRPIFENEGRHAYDVACKKEDDKVKNEVAELQKKYGYGK